jgi:hypothetical protein
VEEHLHHKHKDLGSNPHATKKGMIKILSLQKEVVKGKMVIKNKWAKWKINIKTHI